MDPQGLPSPLQPPAGRPGGGGVSVGGEMPGERISVQADDQIEAVQELLGAARQVGTVEDVGDGAFEGGDREGLADPVNGGDATRGRARRRVGRSGR